MSYSANFPVFASRIDAENYLKGMGDPTSAINWDGVIDNDDLPFWDLVHQLVDYLTGSDIGIGSLGSDVSAEDWTDDLPFIGLDDLDDYVDKLKDIIDGLTDGVIDPAIDIPYDDVWDDVIGGSIPADDPRVENPSKDKPVTGDKDDVVDTPIDDVIDIPLIVPDTSGSFTDITDSLKNKFPFSLPWDIYYLFSRLAHTPRTPVYYLPLVIERLGIDETIVIDMSDFEDFSSLSRLMLSLLYAYGLMNWTVKIVSVRKEE